MIHETKTVVCDICSYSEKRRETYQPNNGWWSVCIKKEDEYPGTTFDICASCWNNEKLQASNVPALTKRFLAILFPDKENE